MVASDSWAAERMFTTKSEGFECLLSSVARNEVARREGTRRENATRGCGSRAMEVKEERVAPWYRGDTDMWSSGSCFSEEEDSECRMVVTTVTGWAVSRNKARKSSFTLELGAVE
jgi:hypothetical protein